MIHRKRNNCWRAFYFVTVMRNRVIDAACEVEVWGERELRKACVSNRLSHQRIQAFLSLLRELLFVLGLGMEGALFWLIPY